MSERVIFRLAVDRRELEGSRMSGLRVQSAGKFDSLQPCACTGQVLQGRVSVGEGRMPEAEKPSPCERVSASAVLVCWQGVDWDSKRVRWEMIQPRKAS